LLRIAGSTEESMSPQRSAAGGTRLPFSLARRARFTLGAAAAVALLGSLAAAVPAGAASNRHPEGWTQVRPLSPSARDLLAEATARSPSVRSLVQQIEESDVIVFFTLRYARYQTEPRGQLRFMTRAGGYRMLLVDVESWYSDRLEQMAMLGHELQHAAEVASAPEVVDEAGLLALYRDIGREMQRGHFETALAASTEQMVMRELLTES